MRFIRLFVLLLPLLATAVARGEDAAPAPAVGFYTLEARDVYDPSFDQAQVPALTYWYLDVDATVRGANYGVVPAAINKYGVFLRTKIRVRGDKNTPPEERYDSDMRWRAVVKEKVKKGAGGSAELLLASNGETILRLYTKKKKEKLADYALKFLGTDQSAAAAALKLDPAKFPRTLYFAHRGVARLRLTNRRGVFAGNTIEAMEHALWNGYPGFEIDIQMTKDRQLIVSHDQKLGVSTNCKGNVSDKTLAELEGCRVSYTGVVPDVKLFHNPARISSAMPTLKAVLDKFLADPRLKHVVLDVKPGDLDLQAAAFSALIGQYPATSQSKIIFLMRSTELIHKIQKDDGINKPLYAWEGSTGWETLERATRSDQASQIFVDEDGENEPAATNADETVGLSLSLGLGLGMAGLNDNHRGGEITAIWQILKSLPKVVHRLFENHFGDGAVDIDALAWSKRNKAALKRLIAAAKERGEKIVGWTINSPSKIEWLRENSGDIDYILSDLPYSRIVALQLAELSSAL